MKSMQSMKLVAGLLLLTCCASAEISTASFRDATPSNDLPIVGILAQEVYKNGLIARSYPEKFYTSYIAASYVKFIEGAGGRVVPIWIGQPVEYYEDLMRKINGVLLPGGATWFNNTGGYAEAGAEIVRIAMQLNDEGVYMPVWGTCLGMELLVYLLANNSDARTDCQSQNQALPLEFKADFQQSRLFRNATDYLIEIWRKQPVTVNYHRYCYTEKTFAAMGLNKIWNVLSLNHDWNGIEFISIIEHKRYPIYAVQFHPEKNLYEFATHRNITHFPQAVRSSQYFADFFAIETRKNQQKFKNHTEEINALIFNYTPEYTGYVGSAFVQQYLFQDPELARGAAAACLHGMPPSGRIIYSLSTFLFIALQVKLNSGVWL